MDTLDLPYVPHHQTISNVTATNHSQVSAGVHVYVDRKPVLDSLPVAKQAPFDSKSDQDHPLCLEDTRRDVLKEIRAWVYGQEESCIFWLSGMAGTGKSTIARTISRELSVRGELGASFFFARGEEEEAPVGQFFTSIAWQFSLAFPALKPHISEAVQKQPDIASKSRKDQWTKLIVDPLAQAHLAPEHSTLVIVVDALDECDNENDMKGIVALLAQAKSVTSVRMRIILTSRPETPIRLGFRMLPQVLHRDLLLHEVTKETVDGDICLFLYSQFKEVKQEQEWLAEDWPGVDVVNQLVNMSGGLFIFAATVCRFVREGRHSAEDALSTFVLDDSGGRSMLQENVDADERSNTAFLDAMYREIMKQSLRNRGGPASGPVARVVRDTVGAIATLREPLPVCAIACLLCASEANIHFNLRRLHSVVRMPAANDIPVRIFHESFRDFLFDLQRCQEPDIHVNKGAMHGQLLQHCISLMDSSLSRNICGLKYPGVQVDQVDKSVVDARLPLHVQYACRSWTYHLQHATAVEVDVLEFLRTHLLHWLEAMSLMGRLAQSVQMLTELQNSIAEDVEDARRFVQDAIGFVLLCRVGVEEAPLQIYEAALLFAPPVSKIREKFSGQMPRWISCKHLNKERSNMCLHVLEGHSAEIDHLAFSPTGDLLVSGSFDATIRLWDTTSGIPVHKLEGENGVSGESGVSAVAFSPDGKMLASVFFQNVVELWDTARGTSIYQLAGHNDTINAVAFSPDGRTIASASDDQTIRLWNAKSGTVMHQLDCHPGRVMTVTFSQDGTIVASTSKTVRLWVAMTGAMIHELAGPCTSTVAVDFSPNGKTVASASGMTVRLWDVKSGALVRDLKGHSKNLKALAFSPDGETLASASQDKTVRLWSSRTYKTVHKLGGPLDRASNIAFSPDGKIIASTSDEVIRLWDTNSGAIICTLVGHLDSVITISFSPDGRMIASASEDQTIRLWDVTNLNRETETSKPLFLASAIAFSQEGTTLAMASENGAVQLWDISSKREPRELFDHHGQVDLVAFSPDGCMVLSAFDDHTMRLWATTSGILIHHLEGHTGSVTSVAFTPHGKILASASCDRTVRLWDMSSGAVIYTFLGHSESVEAVRFSPDGRMFASAALDGTVQLHRMQLQIVTRSFEERKLVGHTAAVTDVVFSPDSKTVASASCDTTVRLWDAINGTCVYTFTGDGNWVEAVSFSPDGIILETATHDEIRVWDTRTRTVIRCLSNVGASHKLLYPSNDSSPPTSHDYEIPNSPCVSNGTSSQFRPCHISFRGAWLLLDSYPMLWLPAKYRMSYSSAHLNTVAIGHKSGSVSFVTIHCGN